MLTSVELIDEVKKGHVFTRVILEPSKKNINSSDDESNWEIELRKASRRLHIPTRSKKDDRTQKDGNPNRSFTMVVPGAKLFKFGDVGYGVVHPDTKDIVGMSVDMNKYLTGVGKKKRDYAHHISDGVINQDLSIDEQLNQLYDYFKKNKGINKTNEVVMRVRDDMIKFIFFVKRNNPYLYLLNIYEAKYMQREYEKRFNIKLPIFVYSRTEPYFKLY
jgi:hypothetical protein